MIWTEAYRPKNLKDFIGNRHIVRASKGWMESWQKNKPILPILILHGRSGIGKTTLSHCLADEFKCAISELNASDERNVKDMKRAIQNTGIAGLDTKYRLTVFDEADNMNKKAQKLLVDKVKLIKQPVILLVNDMDRIIPELQKISLRLELRKPSEMEKLMLAKEIIEAEGIEPWDLKAIVNSSESYRDLLNSLLIDVHGRGFQDDYEDNNLGLIEAMLRGKIGSERLKISPDELLRFVYQNKIHSSLRDIDAWLTISKTTGNYRLWAHSFAILELQRYDGEVKKPKSEFKSRKDKKKIEKIPPKKTEIKAKKVGSSVKANKSSGLLSHLRTKRERITHN